MSRPPYQSYQSGIETATVNEIMIRYRLAINRTKVELKLNNVIFGFLSNSSINRTKVELKPRNVQPLPADFQLSIVPKWN